MIRTLLENWALFLGIALLMVSNGLLGTVLTIRGVELGFDAVTIGLMQAGYPLGALVGCVVAPKLVERVGHIRAFGALASLCSTAAVVHLVTADPLVWGVMRILAGFCFPGLYVVCESWLNAKASNESRARVLSIYFVVGALGSAAGSALAAVDDPRGTLLFGATSILISLALVPMLLSAVQAPDYAAPERLPAARLFAISPTAMLGALLNGTLAATLFVATPLYALALGFGPGEAAAMVVTATLSGALFQYPMGWISDRTDRRFVIALGALIAAIVALMLGLGVWPFSVFAGVALLAGFSLPIYGICVAHANDHLTPGQIVPASGTLVLALNVGILGGALIGPSTVGLAGPAGMMLFLALINGLTLLVAMIRVARADAPEETRAAQALGTQGLQSAGRLHPEAMEQKPAARTAG